MAVAHDPCDIIIRRRIKGRGQQHKSAGPTYEKTHQWYFLVWSGLEYRRYRAKVYGGGFKFYRPRPINAEKCDAAAFWLHFTVSDLGGRRYTSTGLHGYLNC